MTIQDHGGLRVPDFMPTLDIEGGFVTLTCKHGHRLSISASIERLIDMLDAMDGDPDLEDGADEEPWLGWPIGGQRVANVVYSDDDREADESDSEPSLGAPERHPSSQEAVYCGATQPRSGVLTRDRIFSQEEWAMGDTSGDDREHDDEREPDQDDEYSTGWDNEGSQAVLCSDNELEPELGWPEQTNQIDRSVVTDGWLITDGEPDLGFVGIATGWRDGEDKLDRERDQLGDDEREHDHAEHGIVELCEDDFLLPYDTGSSGGRAIAEALLAKAEMRNVAELTYAEISIVTPDGTIIRNFVASDEAKVIH